MSWGLGQVASLTRLRGGNAMVVRFFEWSVRADESAGRQRSQGRNHRMLPSDLWLVSLAVFRSAEDFDGLHGGGVPIF